MIHISRSGEGFVHLSFNSGKAFLKGDSLTINHAHSFLVLRVGRLDVAIIDFTHDELKIDNAGLVCHSSGVCCAIEATP